MTARPDWIFANVVLRDGAGHPLCGTWGASAEELDDIKYVRLDGPTMQAAIAAAEARGLEQGLRRAARLLRDEYGLHTAADAILALIPLSPSPVAASRGGETDNKEPTNE